MSQPFEERVAHPDDRPHPRIQLSALWAATLLIFAYVDIFGLFRPDIRADIEAGKIYTFDIGQAFLLGATIYVGIASLMVAWCVVGPARPVRISNLILAPIYAITIAGGAVGEWAYYIAGSAAEVMLLAVATSIAYRWKVPQTT